MKEGDKVTFRIDFISPSGLYFKEGDTYILDYVCYDTVILKNYENLNISVARIIPLEQYKTLKFNKKVNSLIND